MESKEVIIQQAILNILNFTKNEYEVTDLLNFSFEEAVNSLSDIAGANKAVLLLNVANKLKTSGKQNGLFAQCNFDDEGTCLCQKLATSNAIIHCSKPEFEEQNLLCIPIKPNNKTNGAFIIQVEKQPENTDKHTVFLLKSLIESIISNKLKEIELSKKAQQQNILNQKLFAQSIEIDQKNMEIKANEKKIKEQFEELQAVEEELRQNNEELQVLLESIEDQRFQLENMNIKLRESSKQIESAHKELLAGINYAKTIQQALLTSKELVDTYLESSFIFAKPKDNVSGDFYYVNKVKNKIYVAVADCTGHGVAGGFLTMLAITYLHESVYRKDISNPADILTYLRNRFKRTFRDFGTDNNNGLNIALCSIDTETKTIQFAGANNPVWICRNNEIIELSGTRNPIGNYPKEIEFTFAEILLKQNDSVYLFTDGFKDQLGGEKRTKYKAFRFRKLLLEICELPMNEQLAIMENTFNTWQGTNKQTDDVLILGFTV